MKVFFTLAGAKHYYGDDFLKPGMKGTAEERSRQ